MPRAALLPLILGQPDAILEDDATFALQGVEDMDRRRFTMLAAGLTASAMLPVPQRADHQPLARRLYQETTLLADSAGDSEQCVHLAACTGRQGFAREALRFTDRAAEAARHEPSPAPHSLIWMRRSLAHAQLGDDVAFRLAVTTARRELDRGPHETDPTWTKFVRHSEITSYEAAGRAHFGASAQAVKLYHAVLDDTARSSRDKACQRASLAETLVQAGDFDQTITHGLMILPDLGTTLTSRRVLQRLRSVREAANATTAAEFCDRFDAADRALSTA